MRKCLQINNHELGRTTVWDDPLRGHSKRNGSFYLLPCLESQSPIDLVIMMLGTNDLKARFCVTLYDIAESLGYLVGIMKRSKSGPDGATPALLLMAPPPLGKLSEYADYPVHEINVTQLPCTFFSRG